MPIIIITPRLKWCPSSLLQHPRKGRRIPKPQPCFMVQKGINIANNLQKPRYIRHDNITLLVNTQKLSIHRYSQTSFIYSWSLRRLNTGSKRTCFSSSFSGGVAVTLCGMEDQCVCTAAGRFLSLAILRCRETAAIWWHCASSQGRLSDSVTCRANPQSFKQIHLPLSYNVHTRRYLSGSFLNSRRQRGLVLVDTANQLASQLHLAYLTLLSDCCKDEPRYICMDVY